MSADVRRMSGRAAERDARYAEDKTHIPRPQLPCRQNGRVGVCIGVGSCACDSVHLDVHTTPPMEHLICLPDVLPFARSGTSTCFSHESPRSSGGVVATVSAARATAACSPIVSITCTVHGLQIQ
jgi:hypothetical protein